MGSGWDRLARLKGDLSPLPTESEVELLAALVRHGGDVRVAAVDQIIGYQHARNRLGRIYQRLGVHNALSAVWLMRREIEVRLAPASDTPEDGR
jgi:hypothetical protein